MTNKELENIIKNAKPWNPPELKANIKKSCQNCADSIVCYGLNEPPKGTKEAEKCPDWHLDFMEYQDLLEEQEKSTTEEQNQL